MKKNSSNKNTLQMIISGIAVIVVVVLLVNLFGLGDKSTGNKEVYVNNSAKKVRISLDEFAGWNHMLYANGGLITTADSINAKNGIFVEYVIMNNATESSSALISGDLDGAGYTVNRYAFLQKKFDEAGVR